MIEVFTAHKLFDPFGIERHGEMEVVLKTDHATKRDNLLEPTQATLDAIVATRRQEPKG